MAPKMSVVRKLLLGSPASFKQQRKSEAARSSTPYKICSSRKATNLPPKPTRHRAKRLEAANQLQRGQMPAAIHNVLILLELEIEHRSLQVIKPRIQTPRDNVAITAASV